MQQKQYLRPLFLFLPTDQEFRQLAATSPMA
jgi:hypothetical protein